VYETVAGTAGVAAKFFVTNATPPVTPGSMSATYPAAVESEADKNSGEAPTKIFLADAILKPPVK
jgi:hypothetical protein